MRALLAVLLLIGCKSNESAPAPKPVPAPAAPAAGSAIDPWADDTPKPLPPPKVTRPFARPLLWSASRDGKTTYLFGTLHGGVDGEKRIPLWVWKHFDAATTLIEEASLQDLDILRWTVRPDGSKTLRQELGEDYWKKLEEIVTPLQAGFLDTQATAVATMRVSGYGGGARDAAGPIDGELLVRAQAQRKQLVFLETGKFQSQLFTELHDLAMLKRLIDHRNEIAPLNPAFIEAYVEGDDELLGKLANAQFRLAVDTDAAFDAFMDRLLIARNRAWIPKLEEAHAQGGAFVAVGALHLIGKHSVLELLAERGYAIRRETQP